LICLEKTACFRQLLPLCILNIRQKIKDLKAREAELKKGMIEGTLELNG
jgi:hypothetical protein